MRHTILDAADPRLEPYRAVRERDLVGRQGRFIAEGEVVLRMLLTRSRFTAESVLLGEAQAARLAPAIEAEHPDLPVFVANRTIMDGVAGFPIHRGILAIGTRGEEPDAAALLASCPERALVVALVGLANHDNVGGIFRNAAAFGADAVLLDDGTCDPLYRKAIRVSVGAALTVPFTRAGSANGLVDALMSAGFDVFALSPAGRENLSDTRWSARTALLLGTEGEGLPPEILARLRSVSIPMAAGFDSLNVATTSAIALYEARRAGH